MKGRTKKELRAIGKLVRWIRKQKKRGFDQFRYDRLSHRVIAYKSKDMPRFGELRPMSYAHGHDDSVMAFATKMYANAVISESKETAFAIPVINNVDQIYTLNACGETE